MVKEGYKRKLTAILSADVEGYSRLMGEDEEATVRTLTTYREVLTTLIQQHNGKVLDSPGDNLLAEFVSVVDAVQCAVEIQRDLAERNQEMPENKRMHFRIGVNLGDVVEEKDRIYGDGVNIAARLESMCDGGGVCISGAAFENVENKLDLEFEDLGEHEVKNITKPIRVYRVLSYPGAAAHRVIKAKKAVGKKWRRISLSIAAALILAVAAVAIWNFYWRTSGPPVEAASVEKMVLPLPDKPSIAVLPFVNMSGDPEQEYFSDGITENIITDLSKISGLLVISRSSTFAYKGKPIKIKQVAEEFGVRYVLEGSVQKAGDRIRINAQLIDAITGSHLWAERYDWDLKDIFILQDEITQKIVMTLRIEMNEAELERINRIPTENLTAYESVMRGLGYLRSRKKPANSRAQVMFERAIELDPEYAEPYAFLAWTYLAEWLWGWTNDPRAQERAFELVQKAIRLDNSFAGAYRMLGMIYLWKDRQHDQAIAAVEKAIELDPNHPSNYSTLAEILKFAGRPEEVIELMEKAMRLNPRYPGGYLFQSGSSYYYLGRYDEALALLKRAVTHWPNHLPTRAYLAAIYTELGQETAAQAEVAEILRITPNYSLEQEARYPYKDPTYGERVRNHLRKAGIPEKTPLPLPDKPSIAVLPFDNMSDDPRQEYFSDGITEDIITALSKVPELFVIARNSTFTYKGKPVKIQQVGRELGVKYVLEGSVRKAGNKVRITAQLIDAADGHHLWAERYDRELKDIFAVTDEITKEVVTALQVELTDGEQARVFARGTNNVEAWSLGLKAYKLRMKYSKESFAKSQELVERALKLDPDSVFLWTSMAWIHYIETLFRWSESPAESLKLALEYNKKALTLDPEDPVAHTQLGDLFLMQRKYEKAIAECRLSVTLNPNYADGWGRLGHAFLISGRFEEAIKAYKNSMRVSPVARSWVLVQLGESYIHLGRYEEALPLLMQMLDRGRMGERTPYGFTLANLIWLHTEQAQDDEAKAYAAELLKSFPGYTQEKFAKTRFYKDPAHLKPILSALLRAGIPEKPPLPLRM